MKLEPALDSFLAENVKKGVPFGRMSLDHPDRQIAKDFEK
jgi:hypothetical protein